MDDTTRETLRKLQNGFNQLIESLVPKGLGAVPEPGGPAADVWFNWHGGERPVKPDALVEVRHRDGSIGAWACAGSYLWDHTGSSSDIVAWRFAAKQQKPDLDGWVEWGGRRGIPVPNETFVDVKGPNSVEVRNLRVDNVDWSLVKAYRVVAQQTKPAGSTTLTIPAVRLHLAPGEVYAGVVITGSITVGDIEPSMSLVQHHLVLLPDVPVRRLTWDAAKEWAESVGGRLPMMRELLLLRANARSCFENAWYWSGQEAEDGSSGAWGMSFDSGRPEFGPKHTRSLARAVRVVPV